MRFNVDFQVYFNNINSSTERQSMIASVVVTLSDDAARLPGTLAEIALRQELELGEFQGTDRRIPLTIDSASQSAVEDVTVWIRSFVDVEFVDIVFVHFEKTDEVADSRGMKR